MVLKLNTGLLHRLKYLSYYILLLLIPLVLLGSLIHYVYLDVLKKEIEKNNINQVETCKNTIDKELGQIYSIYYQILIDPSFGKFQIQENAIEAVGTLTNYDSMNDLVSSIIICPRGDETLYTSHGTRSLEIFLSLTDTFSDLNAEGFTEIINSVTKPVIKPAITKDADNDSMQGKSIALILPLPPDTKNPDRTVIFLLDNMKILSLLGSQLAEEDEDFILLDKDKSIISSLKGKNYDHLAHYNAIINDVKPENITSRSLEIDHKDYFVSCAVSNITGMYYIRLLPEKQVLSQLYYVRSIFFYTFLLIILASGVVISLNLFNNINPIADLMKFSEKILGNSKNGARTPTIKKAVGEILKNYDKLELQLNKSIPALRDYALDNILHGNVEGDDITHLHDNGFFSQETAKYYFTAVINILKPDSLNSLSMQDVTGFIESFLDNGFEGYCKSATVSNKLILILSMNESSCSFIEERLGTLRTMLSDKFKIETVIGVGNVCQSLSDLGKSFVEANTALDYMLVQGTEAIIFWSQISKQESGGDIWYPKAEIDKLENYMLKWDSQKIEETVNTILVEVKDRKIPLSIAKCISYDIINAAVRGLNQINPTLNPKESINLDIFSLAEIKTMDELLDRIVSLSRKINEFMQYSNQVSSKQLVDAILNYLQKNCTRYDFTVEGMAEHFRVSPVYMRRIFKELTNYNILSYANSLRIEKAKELLKESDLNMQDVVMSVGYLDTSSFARKFKKETGVTPGEFRKINQKT